ncbi:hypothetical protein ACFO1B_02840 [Dactylosporangium siamense]|uniref:Uncharacterized protein n=1 Tax=Dactylosporangium siamense TaxID=685454 RepID=A0A919PZV6_9ACTN|nr:hypothetical protein [Dactylosporangium siamense]GIG52697.1 hypothetical protein Dsi01nite_107380 [Dactylosporangium siamense]
MLLRIASSVTGRTVTLRLEPLAYEFPIAPGDFYTVELPATASEISGVVLYERDSIVVGDGVTRIWNSRGEELHLD